MTNTSNTKTLSELLDSYKANPSVVLANLCPEAECENFLMEEVIRKVQDKCDTVFKYIKLSTVDSKSIKDELRIIKSPVLLLIQQGIIKGIYTGHIGYNQLCQAIGLSTQKAS